MIRQSKFGNNFVFSILGCTQHLFILISIYSDVNGIAHREKLGLRFILKYTRDTLTEIIGTITIRITISYTMKYTSLNVIFFSSLFLFLFLLTVDALFPHGTTQNTNIFIINDSMNFQQYSLCSILITQALFGNYFLCILCKCFMIIVIIVMIIIWVELYYPHVVGLWKWYDKMRLS